MAKSHLSANFLVTKLLVFTKEQREVSIFIFTKNVFLFVGLYVIVSNLRCSTMKTYIMTVAQAYTANNRGFPVRIPYYSRPDAVFNRTGESLGDASNNNAALIMGNRWRLAAIGDESQACNWPSPAPPASTTSAVGATATMAAAGDVTVSVTAPPASRSATEMAEDGEEGAGACLDSLYHYYDCLVIRHDKHEMQRIRPEIVHE